MWIETGFHHHHPPKKKCSPKCLQFLRIYELNSLTIDSCWRI